jgi:hypothetical protein
MLLRQSIILTITMLGIHSVYAQVSMSEGEVSFSNKAFANTKFVQTDSGIFIIENSIGKCRQKVVNSSFVENPPVAVVRKREYIQPQPYKEKPFALHGNITYFFNYRSYIDTPFAEKDVMQHAVQTRLDFMLKEKYPFTVYITSRQSNSYFFSNATDVSFQFHKEQMLENIKRDIRIETDKLLFNKALSLTPSQLYQREKDGLLKDIGNFSDININDKITKLAQAKLEQIQDSVTSLYKDYKEKMQKLEALKLSSNKVSDAQALVEEKEKKIRSTSLNNVEELKGLPSEEISKSISDYKSKPDSVLFSAQQAVADKEKMIRNGIVKVKDSATTLLKNKVEKLENKKQQADSLISAVNKRIADKQKEIENVQKKVAQAEQTLKSYQKKITDSLQKAKNLIAKITDKNTLNEYLHKTGSTIKDIPVLQRLLLSVKQIGLGRSWIDYSELTVKNISLTGFNIEMNPSNVYFAAAAGKVNYRFRDFVVRGNYVGSEQNVALVRAGFGKKDKDNVIVTYYTGQKALLGQTNPLDASATQKIDGFSLETRKKIDEHNYIIAEYARSTSPRLKNKIFDFTNNTNEAFSIKLFSDYGNTKVNGYYRKMGEAFQSFTLQPSNNMQDAWMLRATQSIWKKRILLDAAIRKNDFNSPIAAPNFSNRNVFKSFQVTARIPNYPFVSAGYYPSSQLALSDNNVLYENRYNTLNTIVSHSYYVGKLNMNTNATFTKFYNNGSDTGFIYFNASTFTLNHSVNVSQFVLQGILTITDQSYIKQITVEPVLTYNYKNILSLTGSVKWNRVNKAETLWGGTAGLNVVINKIGVLQAQYDKVFLPGFSRNLLPVDMGRVTFSRTF